MGVEWNIVHISSNVMYLMVHRGTTVPCYECTLVQGSCDMQPKDWIHILCTEPSAVQGKLGWPIL